MPMIALGGQFFGIDKAKRRHKNAPPVHAGNRLATTIIIPVRLELPSRPLRPLCPSWSPLQRLPPPPTTHEHPNQGQDASQSGFMHVHPSSYWLPMEWYRVLSHTSQATDFQAQPSPTPLNVPLVQSRGFARLSASSVAAGFPMNASSSSAHSMPRTCKHGPLDFARPTAATGVATCTSVRL